MYLKNQMQQLPEISTVRRNLVAIPPLRISVRVLTFLWLKRKIPLHLSLGNLSKPLPTETSECKDHLSANAWLHQSCPRALLTTSSQEKQRNSAHSPQEFGKKMELA